MKETLRNMFFHIKKEYNAFEENLEKHLDEEVSWSDFIPFWSSPQKPKAEDNTITHKLKKD